MGFDCSVMAIDKRNVGGTTLYSVRARFRLQRSV